MKKKFNLKAYTIVVLAAIFMWLFISPDFLEARGGGGGGRSFGGSRSSGGSSRSFGGTRSVSKPAAAPATKSFGGTKSTTAAAATTPSRPAPSFGGSKLNNSSEYTSKYGSPRRQMTSAQNSSIPHNYVVYDYGGYSHGLMMGYMMGYRPWYWGVPFHPYFYYSQPYYSHNPDGTTSVYPPTFDWGRLFFTLIIFVLIVYIIYVIVRSIRRKRKGDFSQSSFS